MVTCFLISQVANGLRSIKDGFSSVSTGCAGIGPLTQVRSGTRDPNVLLGSRTLVRPFSLVLGASRGGHSVGKGPAGTAP